MLCNKYYDGLIHEYKMGRALSMHEYRPKHTQGFGRKISMRPLGRPTHRYEDNIKTDLKVTGWKGLRWINLGLVRDQRKENMVINLWVT
jgi:hypothetical protein